MWILHGHQWYHIICLTIYLVQHPRVLVLGLLLVIDVVSYIEHIHISFM